MNTIVRIYIKEREYEQINILACVKGLRHKSQKRVINITIDHLIVISLKLLAYFFANIYPYPLNKKCKGISRVGVSIVL